MHIERWLPLAMAAGFVLGASAPAAARDRDCAIETRLHWIDVLAKAPFAYGSMAGEMSSRLADHGVCASVKRTAPSAVRARGEIAIVMLHTMPGSGEGRRVMGATRARDPRNATVWVYFDEVAGALDLAGRATETWSGQERAAFGRALGRVAAHEVLHALLPGRPHDEAGLMAATLGRHALTAPSLSIHAALLADVWRAGSFQQWSDHSWFATR